MRAALALLVVWLPSVASADAVPPTPECPAGARGVRSHAGQWCETSPCSTDHDCTGGSSCAPLRMCVVTSRIAPGGLRPAGSAPPPRIANLVVASCPPNADCAGSDQAVWPRTAGDIADRTPRCAVATYCVDPSSIPVAPVEPAPVEPAPVEPAEATATARATAIEHAPSAAASAPPASSGCASASANGSPLPYLAIALITIIARRRQA